MYEKNCLFETLQLKVEQLEKESKNKDKEIENQKEEIYDLTLVKKTATQVSNKLNKDISDLKLRFQKENNLIVKEHKTEIKYWRKTTWSGN